MSFLGTFANWTGYVAGNFTVQGLAGRDKAGAPQWTVACGKCGQAQVIPHAKVASVIQTKAPDNLTCANAACPLSRSRDRQYESFADFRKRQRREAEQVARQAATDEELRQEKVAKHQAENSKLAALQAEYRTYWLHQIKTIIEESEIASFRRWQQLPQETRLMILDRLDKDPTLRVKGL